MKRDEENAVDRALGQTRNAAQSFRCKADEHRGEGMYLWYLTKLRWRITPQMRFSAAFLLVAPQVVDQFMKTVNDNAIRWGQTPFTVE